MKLTKYILLTLTLLGVALAQQGCSFLQTLDKKGAEKIDTTKDLYPGDLKADKNYSVALANALTQTTAARKLFYQPNDVANGIIKTAANNLINAYNKDPSGFKAFASSAEQRQTTYRGTLQTLYTPELLDEVAKANPQFESRDALKFEKLAVALEKLIPKMKVDKPEATDILGFLGWMGDMAAAITDSYGRGGSKPVQQTFADFMKTKFIKNLDTKVKSDLYGKYSPDKYYTGDKKNERRTCSVNDKSPDMKQVLRAGVMDTGEDADKKLNPKTKLPTIGWPWQTIPVALTNFCKDEPWAGHVSGSFYELVFLCQIFAQTPDASGMFDANLADSKDKNRDGCIAWGSAFLIATGMHSSIEIAYAAQKMQESKDIPDKFDLKDDKLKKTLCTDGSSTKFTSDLHGKFTNKKRRLK